MIERLPVDAPPHVAHGHRVRYHLARGLLMNGDRVLDAACGVGYGTDILSDAPGAHVVGVDRSDVFGPFRGVFIQADLADGWPLSSDVDVTVSFETIEHLVDPEAFVEQVCRHTRRAIIASVPVVPTVLTNEFHLHDFLPGELPTWAAFAENGWQLVQSLGQPSELSEIYVWERT